MTTSFTHRALHHGDLDFVAALHADAFAPLGERGWTRREIAELLETPGVVGLLLQSDQEKIGFALGRVAADESELLTLAVQTDRRRRGAGRALLNLVVALMRERGARHLFLEVGADNAAALALYRGAGFQSVGRRPAYYSRRAGAAAAAVVMRLALE